MTIAAQNTRRHKLVLLGESSVGKSSLVLRMVRQEWCDNQCPTIGASFLKLNVPATESGEAAVCLDVWDTAGQERYRSLASMYYRGASAAIVVYDITSASSFEKAKYWIKELAQNGGSDIVIALAGNKLDLVQNTDQRQISLADARQYAEENNLILYETSAKSGENTKELLDTIVSRLRTLQATNAEQEVNRTRTLLNEKNVSKDEKPCC